MPPPELKIDSEEDMGALMKDSTTLDILVQLNRRFEAGDAIVEMVALQKEFKVFSLSHSLRQSFALLSLVPSDWTERKRWYRFLDYLKTYGSDMQGVNGHDRVIRAFADNLQSENPLPVTIKCHAAKDDPRVTVSQGMPVIFSMEEYVVVSIPTTPGREARKQAATTARQRRSSRKKGSK
jgi:hypothetical protein